MRTYLTTLKRGAQSLAGILEDFSSVEEAIKTMENAAGSADREMDIIRDSLEFKINALKQTWVKTLTSIIDRGEVGSIVDNFTTASEAIGVLISRVGALKTAFIALSTVIGSKKLGLFGFNSNGLGLGTVGLGASIRSGQSTKSDIEALTNIRSQLSDNYDLSGNEPIPLFNYEEMIDDVKGLSVESHNMLTTLQEDNINVADTVSAIDDRILTLQNSGSKVTGIFRKLGDTLVNGLVSFGVSAAISLLVTGIEHLVNRAKYIEKAADTARSSISSIRSELDKSSSTVEKVSSRYAELAQQVNNIGTVSQNQGNLSNDEYKEFLDISNQLAEVFPTLTQGYTENGDALLGLSGSVDTITDRLNKLYEAEQRAANQKIYDNMKDVWKGYKEDVQGVYGSDSILNQKRNLTNYYTVGTSEIATTANPYGKTYEATIQQQREAFNKAIVNGQSELIKYVPTATREAFDKVGLLYFDYFNKEGKQIKDLSGDQVKAINAAFVEINKEYDDEIAKLDNQLQNKNMDLANDMLSSFEAVSEKYESYSDEQKILLENIVRNYDFSQLTDDEGNILKWDDAFKKFTDDIESTLDLSEDQLKELSSTWTGLMSLKLDEGVYAENLEKLRTYLRTIAALLGYSVEEVSSLLGYDSAFEKYDQARERLGYSEKPGSRAEAEKNAEIDKFLSTLTPEELEYFATINIDEYKSLDEIKEALGKMQNYADSNVIEVRTNVGAAENLDAMKTAFDDLDTAYMSSVKNQDSSGNATNNIASAADIQGVNDAFGGITEITTDTELADINALSNALEVYDTALIENKGDAVVAQKAADQLATAYVDLSDVLDNLTEENKEYYIEQLKASGIENAEKVVNSRLSEQYQKTREALEKLSKSVAKNRKYLDVGADAGKDYEDAISDIKDDVRELISVYDDNGEIDKDLTPEFSDEQMTQFIKDNLADIEAATEGDIDALNRLRLEVARINAAKAYIDIDLPSDVVSAQLDNLMDKVAEVDAMDIEVGATVDDTAFIAALQNMINSGQTTAEAVSRAFESMGYNVEWTPHPYTVQYVKAHETDIKDSKAYNTMLEKATETIDMPSLKITRASSATGAKVSNYSGSSNSSSSGGGDGGSDSSNDEADEDAKETFDWIEVYINRIEEAISRLDEVIDDVYDNWANRNEAVTNKISKLTDEIEAQTTAAKKYKEYAESLQVNDGENINADDYENGADDAQYIYDKAQYDAAVAAWATGTYQTKIQEGRKDEIEEIQNQYLKDIIDEYTEWWDKHIAAGDAVKGLEISVKDQYKQLFENVESEYEDLLTNIEKKSDIIDERITRIEEHGFFVDKSYYEQLRELALKNEEELTKELDDLVTKFNNAVENGHIKKGTEGWNEMYQSIQDTNKSLEEAHTKIVQIDNDIRQLQWDKFDWLEERMSDVAEDADFLIKVLQGELNFDEQGNFNNRGFAQASLIGAKYDDAIARAKRYQEAIREIDEQMQTEGGKADKNLIERKESLVDAYRDAIEAAEDEKSAMQSLVKEGIQLQLDSLKELIDEYKNSLSAAKDLYTYQKNIADQTKNIANLEKQLRALENDNSEESRKRKLELQNQLDDAQQSLEETQWDRYISETGTMLDNMYSDYEEFLDDKTKEITVLMNDMIEYINKNASNVEKGLSEIKTEYGFTTQHFEDFTSDQKALLNIFKDGNFSSKFSTITENISNILKTLEKYTDANQNSSREIAEEKSVNIIYDDKTGKVTIVDTEFNANSVAKRAAEEAAKKNGNDNKDDKKTEPEFKSEISDLVEGNFGTWRSDDKGWWFEESDGSYPKNEYRRVNGEMYWFDDQGYAIADDGKWKWDEKGSWFENEDGWYPKDEWVWIDGVQYYFDEDGYVTNKRNYKGYAKGTRSVPSTDLYWTNEQGTEGIFKTDSGAILTPLNAGDMVFNHQQMEWLFDASKAAISGANKISPKIPGRSFGNFNATNNLTVVLPNVESYDDFKRQMKADRNVQQWMQEVTIGQMMGNNKLNGKKY